MTTEKIDWNEPYLSRTQIERMHNANIAKLRQLATDADTMAGEASDSINQAHWRGMRDGLLRSITVLEGRG